MVFVRRMRPAFVALFLFGMMCLGIVSVSGSSANITFGDLTKQELAFLADIRETDVVKIVIEKYEGSMVEFWVDIYRNDSPKSISELDHNLILRPDESIQLAQGVYHIESGTDFTLLFLQNRRREGSIEFITATIDGQSKTRITQTVEIEEFSDPEFIWSTGPETVRFAYDEPIPIYQITGVRKRDGQAVMSSYMSGNPSIQAQLHDIHMVVYVKVSR